MNKSIHIKLISGPLKTLKGKWRFIFLSKTTCKVKFQMQVEYGETPFLKNILYVILNKNIKFIINAFKMRAQKIYSKK